MKHNIVEITDAQFDAVISQHKLVLVDFWAPWCTPCLQFAPVIEQIAAMYKGKVCVTKLNIGENSQTPVKYNIQKIPAVLCFHQGQPVDHWIGNVPIVQIQQSLDSYLS